MKRVGLVCALVAMGCTNSSNAIETRTVEAPAKAAFRAQNLALPAGTMASAVWLDEDGTGLIGTTDGRYFSVGTDGVVFPIPRIAGEMAGANEAPVRSFVTRGGGSVMALVPGGAMLVQSGVYTRAALPDFLASPQGFSPYGAEALWATSSGLYSSDGARWLRLDEASGPIVDASQLVGFSIGQSTRDAWVLTGQTVKRVQLVSGAMAMVSYASFVPPGVETGPIRSISAVDDTRGIAMGEQGVTFVAPDRVRVFRRGALPAPDAIGGGGGRGWAVWGGSLLRTNGETWETWFTDTNRFPLANPTLRIAVDQALGNSALAIDGTGAVLRVESEPTLWLSGVRNNAFVQSTRLDLEPTQTTGLREVTYTLDGTMLVQRTTAPWGWSSDGLRTRDLGRLSFGAHVVDVLAKQTNGPDLTRAIRFDYVSPLGRVPSYAQDIAPMYEARCARCHTNGVAQELGNYQRLVGFATSVRKVIQERRMPPDIQLDTASANVFLTWIDGATPP